MRNVTAAWGCEKNMETLASPWGCLLDKQAVDGRLSQGLASTSELLRMASAAALTVAWSQPRRVLAASSSALDVAWRQPRKVLEASLEASNSALDVACDVAWRAPARKVMEASNAALSAACRQPRRVLHASNAALGWGFGLLPLQTVLPFARKGEAARGECLRVEIKLANGHDMRLDLTEETSVAAMQEHVARAVGVPARRQFLVVAEERARGASLGHLAKRMQLNLSAPKDLRSSLIQWINFVFLPEAVNRELYGRGVIGLVKSSHWYQQLQESQQLSLPAIGDAVRVQIETLAGQVLAAEVDSSASLAAMRAGIERETGVLAEQQRLLILERNGPSALTSVTNTLLRQSLGATRSLAGAAAWAATRLLGAQRPPNGFTIQVKTHGGQCLSLDVTGDMTLDELRVMLEDAARPAKAAAAAAESLTGVAALAAAASDAALGMQAVHAIMFPELPPPPLVQPPSVRVCAI
ncbi:hypothetical protein WJX81_001633 [Elliptochloris bilobata]|uniref:Ubiquitin-like domain-containing protein n=1 Tax=Elliptochloris bilobata TaxID=381761 RepID=A0AAW1RTW0_9CHLO